MLYAPLVMPEVISGLSLAAAVRRAATAGRASRNRDHCRTQRSPCARHVVVQSRLGRSTRSLEGPRWTWLQFPFAPPVGDPALIIRPSPRLDARLTLSLDDVVIASFTTARARRRCRSALFRVRLGVKPEINAICTNGDRR